MIISLYVTVLGVCFFIAIVNYYFQKAKYKNLVKEQKKQLNVLNSPNAWLCYTFAIAIITGVVLCASFANIITGSDYVKQQQDTLTQQQSDAAGETDTTTQTDDTTTQTGDTSDQTTNSSN